MVLGFAFLHAATRGVAGRAALLAGAYILVGILGWPALGMVALGVAATLFTARPYRQARPSGVTGRLIRPLAIY